MSDNINKVKYPGSMLAEIYTGSYHYYPQSKDIRDYLNELFAYFKDKTQDLEQSLNRMADMNWQTIVQDSMSVYRGVHTLLSEINEMQEDLGWADVYLESMGKAWTKWNAKMEERRAAKDAKQKTEAEEGDAVVGVKPVNVEAKGGNAT